jgi:hypothetical protein
MKYSFHSLISFLQLFCNCQFRRRDSVQFFCPQAHILAGWRLETRPYFFLTELFFIIIFHGPRRKHSVSIAGKTCLHWNGTYSIVACVFIVKGICLKSRCLVMNVYSDFAISTFGRSVTIFCSWIGSLPLTESAKPEGLKKITKHNSTSLLLQSRWKCADSGVEGGSVLSVIYSDPRAEL